MLTESPSCPKHKRTQMILKYGRYGKFWGCPRYPKCRETLDIPGDRKQRFKNVRFTLSNDRSIYDLFKTNDTLELYRVIVRTPAYEYILNLSKSETIKPYYISALQEIIKRISSQSLDEIIPSGIDSALFDYLVKVEKKYHYAAIWAYFIYRLKGTLDNKMDFFLSTFDYPYESSLIKTIKNYHDECLLFNLLSVELLGFWEYIPHGEVDLLGIDIDTKLPIAFEVKVKKHNLAIGQAIQYRYVLSHVNKSKAASYIIAKGWPDLFFKSPHESIDTIGLISYVIEGTEILFIPWRKAAFIQ